MDKQFLKGLVDKESINEKDGTISVAVATDSSVDRDGEIVSTDGIDTKNFERNPVLLYAHDYRSDPIGKVIQIVKENNRMLFTPQFAVDVSPRAKQYFDLVKGGFLNAFSIGFIPKTWEDRQNSDGSISRVFTTSELLEISLVPVPANPQALVLARSYKSTEGKGFDEDILKDLEAAIESKTVVTYKDYGVVQNLGAAWDGPAQVKACGDDFEKLKDISTWFDSENAAAKLGYKLPHHQASDKKAIWRGVAAAMGALLGAQGGVSIPESDRKGVYDHLAKHYAQFEKTPPDFKLVEAQVLKDVDLAFDGDAVVQILQTDSDTIKQMAADAVRNALSENREKKAPSVDELLGGGDVQRRVLVAVDKAIGLALEQMRKESNLS